MKNSTVQKYIDILKEIKESGKSIKAYCEENGLSVSNIYRVKCRLEVSNELYREFMTLYHQITKRNYGYDEEILEEETSTNEIDKVTIVRDSEEKIIEYKIHVPLKDKEPFEVDLTRREVEDIFGLYTYYGGNITARNVANEFPRFTLPEVKRIIRAFGITKDSAWFPPHLLEEMDDEQLTQYRMNLKERAAFKYADSRREQDYTKQIKDLAERLNKALDRNTFLQQLQLNKYNIKPNIIFNSKERENSLIIYLSDMHFGAYNPPYAYDDIVNYNENIIRSRLNLVLSKFQYKKYSNIIVCNLGDSIDSYKSETSRGGHLLPNVMSDKDKVQLYIKLMVEFFTSLKTSKSPIFYYCVGESNHDGDWGWLSNVLLSEKLKELGITSYISDKPMDKFNLNGNVFLYLHGKDNSNQNKGFPLVLNDKTESWFNSYFINNKITAQKGIYVVKGDLHQHAVTVGKTFTYVSAASLYGCSNWIVANFGKTPWGITYMEVSSDGDVMEGLIRE